MRLIHTSDWHLGRTLHGESLLEHQGEFLRWLLTEAVREQADAVVVAGDVYDRAVPSTDAVALLDATLTAFARERIPMVITSGNHDSAVRLGFGSGLSEAAGIHLRTSVADLARPVVLTDSAGELAVYGIPYLLPDAVMAELGAERSHASVLSAASARIRADAAVRGIGRVVIAAHAFVTGSAAGGPEPGSPVPEPGGPGHAGPQPGEPEPGGPGHAGPQPGEPEPGGPGHAGPQPGEPEPGWPSEPSGPGQPVTCESERDIRVGGIAHAPASVFGDVCYVALGHLHGQQLVSPGAGSRSAGSRGTVPGGTVPGAPVVGGRSAGGPVVRYCGSPLAFSFSERDHRKSVTVVDIDAAGQVLTRQLPAPVPRPLREVRGRIGDLLARADGDLADLAGAWVKAVLTDQVRPAAPMERLRARWPHTIALDFQPEGGLVTPDADRSRLARAAGPTEICGLFVEYAGGGPPDAAERQVLRDAVEAAQHAEAAA